MWKKRSLNTKITAAFVAISVLVGITGWVAMDGINRISSFVDHSLTEQLDHGRLVNEIERNMLKSQDATGEFLAATELTELPAIRRDFAEAIAAFQAPLSTLSGLELDPTESVLVSEIGRLQKEYSSAVEAMMDHHEEALVNREQTNRGMKQMAETTPRMLKGVQFVGVSEAEQNLITQHVMTAFNYVATRDDALMDRFDQIGGEIKKSAHYAAFAEYYTEFIDVASQVIAAVANEERSAAAAGSDMARLDRYSLSLQQRAEKLLIRQRQEIASAQAGVMQIETRTGRIMSGLSVAAVLMSLLIGLALSRSIVAPLTRTIDALTEGSTQVEHSAVSISRASMQQAEGASEQAAAIQETTSTMGDMSTRTEANASHAVTASGLAAETRDAAGVGNDRMKEMAEAMRQIHDSSNQIAKVINVIDDIAFQTNILALNAAVEAARAGEAGMGFAVVADEVRNLAQRSAAAAKDTASMISESISRSTRGMTIMEGASSALDQITFRALEVSDLVDKIADASRDQSSGISQMTLAMQQMEQVTQQAASSAENSASSGEQLNEQVNGLRDLVDELGTMVWGTDGELQAGDTAYPAMGADEQPWMSASNMDTDHERIISPVRGDKPDREINLF